VAIYSIYRYIDIYRYIVIHAHGGKKWRVKILPRYAADAEVISVRERSVSYLRPTLNKGKGVRVQTVKTYVEVEMYLHSF
jgi:hypothetical protein